MRERGAKKLKSNCHSSRLFGSPSIDAVVVTRKAVGWGFHGFLGHAFGAACGA